VLPVSAPVMVDAVLVAAGALAVRWLTVLVTPATVDAAAVAAGWLAAWLPAGCAVAGCAPAGWAAVGCEAAGWVWADGEWRLLPRLWAALRTVPVTPLTAPARPLVAAGGELAAWPAPLELAVAGGCAGVFAGAADWLAGCPVLGCPVLGCPVLGWAGAVWAGAVWPVAGWAGAGGGGLGWVRLCTAPLAAPASEPSADPGPLAPDDPEVPEDPGSVAAEARPARRNAKMSAAAIPPQTHRETLRARPKARERVADPSTARRLHRVPIIIHTYPPVLSGQNRRTEADNMTDVLPDHT